MAYICLKPCRMAGVDYIRDDIIPDEAVIDTRRAALIDTGIIAEIVSEDVTASEGIVRFTIETKGGMIEISQSELQQAVSVMQLTADEAAAVIAAGSVSSAALDLIAELDTRKTVKTAISAVREGV